MTSMDEQIRGREYPTKDYESSEASLSPQKALTQDSSPASSELSAGPSNGRKTVTKMRAPPQLIQISSESESDDSDDVKAMKGHVEGEYDPKMYADLEVGPDAKELFQYITKYVPQQLALDYKFKPFIPDYIPAVGDIDAFLKVVPPDLDLNGETSTIDSSDLGLTVLDEPAANQSDPAVLHLQLRAASVNVGSSSNVIIKKVDNVEKNTKVVDKWIKDISDLHRSKSSPVFKYSDPMPDLDELMEEWPENMENLLKIHGFPSPTLRGPLSRYIAIVCSLFDIPVHANKMQSLHLLYSLYAAVKTSHLFRETTGNTSGTSTGIGTSGGKMRTLTTNETTDQLLLD